MELEFGGKIGNIAFHSNKGHSWAGSAKNGISYLFALVIAVCGVELLSNINFNNQYLVYIFRRCHITSI